MPDFLVSYDLEKIDPSPYRPMLDAALVQGWLYVLKAAREVHRLPNTTLWGVFDDHDAAVAAFTAAKEAASRKIGKAITVEKRIITRLDDWKVISDVRKPPEARWTGATKFETSRLHQVNDPFFR